jgi:alkylresorcinol/alkylpyrone synthase
MELDLPRSIARVPVWGLGCAGGAAGLARAAALCRGMQRPVLLVAVEICSATFVARDRSKSNLIASALFGDGAAAAVLVPGGSGPRILGGHSLLLDGTTDVMGWNVRDDGLQVRFARSIPSIVREVIPRFVAQSCSAVGIAANAIDHWAVHPGGAKVLEAYADALDLSHACLAAAHEVLRDHGNMSSPTVLFVLERVLATRSAKGHAIVLGLGPGFCAESAVLAW